MPPRHAYWTIIVDNQPTAFRAHDAEELEPTLNRLKEKHPSAVMKWFERGKLWDSRDAARAEGFGRGERRWEGPRPERPETPAGGETREGRPSGDGEKRRDRTWRPGGEHRDPRQKYKDAKKAKWDRFKKNVRERTERKREPAPSDADPSKFTPPHGDPIRDQIDEAKRKKPWVPAGDRDRRPARPRGDGDRRPEWKSQDRPDRDRPRSEWKERPPQREWRDRPPDRRSRPQGDWRDRPQADKRERPQGNWRDRPQGDRRDKPQGDWRSRPQGDWRDRPQGRSTRSTARATGGIDPREIDPTDRRPTGGIVPKEIGRDRPKATGAIVQGDRPDRPRADWRDRPKPDWRDRPANADRAPKDRDRGPRQEGRKPWSPKSKSYSKPKGAKPFGGRGPGGPRRPQGPRGPRKRRDDE